MTTTYNKANLISFCSIPFTDQEKFAKEDLKEKLFKTYKDGLLDISGEDGALYEGLYDTEMYYLWGKYDLCILSSVDDWEFATRFVRPTASNSKSHGEMQNFDYKVVLGINPNKVCSDSLLPLPYIAITQLKLNSAFLIGNGLKFIERVRKAIHQHIVNLKATRGIEIEFTILESFSYHELLIVSKCNSINFLRDIVVTLRNTKFADLMNKDDVETQKLFDDSLFKFLANKNGREPKCADVHNHIFESTLTNFGIHFNLFDKESNYQSCVAPPLPDEKVTFFSKWNIKPGHSQKVMKIIDGIDPEMCTENKAYGIGGKGDLMLIKEVQIDKGKPMFEFPELYFKKSKKKSEEDEELRNHLRETFTMLGFDLAKNPDLDDYSSKQHLDVHSYLDGYTFKESATLKSYLKALWIPKALSEKVIRIVANYNNAVLDPDMYVFYIELRPFINYGIFESVKLYYQNKGKRDYQTYKLIDRLESVCENLEIGFHNRFYQSYWTSEIPEVNTDYSGGIHNLISAYDSCYKALNNIFRINVNKDISFLNVRSDSRIKSSYDTLRMNFLYLIQPYIFSSIATHEALNYSIEKFCDSEFDDDNANPSLNKLIIELINLYTEAGIPLYLPYHKNAFRSYLNQAITPAELFADLKLTEGRFTHDIQSLINTKALRYLITDSLNLNVCFKDDFPLFCNVRWNHFLQSGYVFDYPGKINDSLFLTLTVRLALIKKMNDSQAILTKTDVEKLVPDNILFRVAKEKYSEDIAILVNTVFVLPKLGAWLQRLKSVLGNAQFSFLRKSWVNDEIVDDVTEFLNEQSLDSESLYKLVDNYYKSENPQSISTLYISVLHSILRFYLKRFQILDRDHLTGDPKRKIEGFFLDPCGGSFVVGKLNREKYLGERVKIYQLLYHLSQLQKIKSFK